MINVVTIEDNRVVRLGIKSIISRDGVDVIGEAGSGVEGIKLVLEKKPDVVLLDLYLPDITGVEVCKRIHKKSKDIKVIYVTECQNLSTLNMLLRTSAHGLIRKGGEFKGRAAIIDVCSGKKYVQPDLVYDLLRHKDKRHPLNLLTDAEHEKLISYFYNGYEDNYSKKSLTLKQKDELLRISKKIGVNCLSDLSELLDVHPDPECAPDMVRSC